MKIWNQNVDTSCVFCSHPMETREHLFFQCVYSKKVWAELVKGILDVHFSTNWADVMTLLASADLDKVKRFLLGYTFQNTIHTIWGERNSRRHGEQPSPTGRLEKQIDKNVRNRLSTIARGGDMDGSLQRWFATRQE
ncbi:unnamed protein product [Arabidopsis arenosa]|uniref:Reverse transcriptase zinc-binding domain-containing protein n=1 Tax=Arabidopsis arenosa TaxID=38785 RepID=A0A8S2A537_ARAAE|nr:unnamed protein product [Arabidopsis arenosa]